VSGFRIAEKRQRVPLHHFATDAHGRPPTLLDYGDMIRIAPYSRLKDYMRAGAVANDEIGTAARNWCEAKAGSLQNLHLL
jgi:hypothetical protein